MSATTNPLELVSFGEVDAESDSRLSDFFVDTGVLKRLGDGSRQFVIGRKGSGKTALFQQSQTTLTGSKIVPMEFSDYAWEQHKAVKELGMPAEGAYTASWIFTYLKVLFDFGVIGVPRVGGKRGGSTFEFAYQDRYLDPRFDSDLVVHPALRKHLALRDATAENPDTPLGEAE